MTLNVLYKSTSHVSIGDDMAFSGTKRLFDRVLPDHNAFLYSRKEKDCWKPALEIGIDLVVIAGTPVWSGKEMAALEEFVISKRRPVFYCGVGMNYGENARTSEALSNAVGFIARDNYAYKRAIRDADARCFCCPSIFSIDPQQSTGEKIGIVIQADTWPEEQEGLVRRFHPGDALVICNEIIDYAWAEKNLPEYEAVYSRWLPDLIRYYLRCKEVYSMRIHGAHLAYGLGIPVVCLKSEKDKSVVCKKIGLDLCRPSEVTEGQLRNDQSIKADLYVKFMDYIFLQMRKAFPEHVAADAWDASEFPSDGRPIEWSDERYRSELVSARGKSRELASTP